MRKRCHPFLPPLDCMWKHFGACRTLFLQEGAEPLIRQCYSYLVKYYIINNVPIMLNVAGCLMARLKRRRLFARFLAVCWPPASCAGILLLFCCLPKVIVRCEFEFSVSSFLFMTSVSFFSFVFKSRGLLPLLVGVIGPLLPITTRVAYRTTCSRQYLYQVHTVHIYIYIYI